MCLKYRSTFFLGVKNPKNKFLRYFLNIFHTFVGLPHVPLEKKLRCILWKKKESLNFKNFLFYKNSKNCFFLLIWIFVCKTSLITSLIQIRSFDFFLENIEKKTFLVGLKSEKHEFRIFLEIYQVNHPDWDEK